jgi:hypothetical protein
MCAPCESLCETGRAPKEAYGTICLPLGINQKWERDSRLRAKDLGIVFVAQADGD